MAEHHLGKYEIVDEIGKGGFATVYRAQDLDLGRPVALKVLDPVLTRDPVWVARFRREARAVASLDHPRIVTVHEIGQAEGVLYIAMKLVDGGSLAERITQEGPLPWPAVIRLVEQIAEALDFAHGQGVLHRDLKPANVLLDRRTGAVLTDFGFARLVADNSLSMSLSGASGGIVGTPAYIAPEIWEGDPPATATDVYALGCILYEAVMGQALFTGHSAPAVMRAHFQPRRLPEKWPEGVPAGLRPVLETALAVDPAARYARAGELAAAVAGLAVDPWAEPYAALEAALAAAAWQEAIGLAEQIRGQSPAYRDVVVLEQQAYAGLAEAARRREADGWRREAEAALAEGDLAGADRAARQWQRLAAEDAGAVEFLLRLDAARPLAQPTVAPGSKPGSEMAVEAKAEPSVERPQATARPGAGDVAEVAAPAHPVPDANSAALPTTTTPGTATAGPAPGRIEDRPTAASPAGAAEPTGSQAPLGVGGDGSPKRRSSALISVSLVAALLLVAVGAVAVLRRDNGAALATEGTAVRLPVGSSFFFVSNRVGKREIYRLNAAGQAERVTSTPGQKESWSPVLGPGGSLYFTSDRDGTREIYQLDSTGKTTQVTNTSGRYGSWAPAFDRNGTLYFASSRSGNFDIYRLDSAGKTERVTRSPDGSGSWSPVIGAKGELYMTSDRAGSLEVFRLDQAGKTVQITNTPRSAGSGWPAAGAQGELYFTSYRDGKREIYRIDETGQTTRLTNSQGTAEAWDPVVVDGTLFFTSNRDGKAELYAIDSTGEVVRVTHTSGTGESWWSSEE